MNPSVKHFFPREGNDGTGPGPSRPRSRSRSAGARACHR